MSEYILTGGIIALISIITIITGPQIFGVAFPSTLLAIGIWEALGLLGNLVAPVVGAILTVLVWFHKRLNEVENDTNDMKQSVYGNDQDALNDGVLDEVQKVNSRLETLQKAIDNLRDETD